VCLVELQELCSKRDSGQEWEFCLRELYEMVELSDDMFNDSTPIQSNCRLVGRRRNYPVHLHHLTIMSWLRDTSFNIFC